MNDLSVYQQGSLPAQPTDLAKFIVIAQEKAKALRAEIQAIQKLELAREVYDQKLQEQARLNELVIIAKNRMGDFTSQLPTMVGGRPSKKTGKPRVTSFAKPKEQVLNELGISKMQASNYEKMAAYPDIVEEVIAESQAGQTDATQSEVLRRIKEREQGRVIDLSAARRERFDHDMAQIDEDLKWAKAFDKATHAPFTIADNLDRVAAAVWRNSEGNVSSEISDIDMAIQLLNTIKAKLINGRRLYGST